MRRGQRRPAGLRVAMPRSAPVARRANVPIAAAQKAVAATARLSLASMSIEGLRALWSRRGGDSREYVGGDIELLSPAGERVARAPAPEIERELRERLEVMP